MCHSDCAAERLKRLNPVNEPLQDGPNMSAAESDTVSTVSAPQATKRSRTIAFKTDYLWAFVRVVAPDKDEFGDEVFYPAGHRGKPNEVASCLFCCKKFNGTPDRTSVVFAISESSSNKIIT